MNTTSFMQNINFLDIINKVHRKQLDRFYKWDEFNTDALQTKKRGLYWIWTTLSNEQLSKALHIKGSKHIDISKMIIQRDGFNHICKIQHPTNPEFRIIYNGIGGFKKRTNSCSGLRERILQEFNGTGVNTGTLSIISTKLNPSKFAVSFFNFDEKNNTIELPFLKETNAYLKYASDLEKLWRLEFGIPILCRH